MNLYQLLVFLHVLGAVGIFVALGIESISLSGLQSASAPIDARVWISLLKLPGRLGPIAMITTAAAGVWMMAQGWGRQPWIVSAMVGLIGMAAVGGVISLRGARRLRVALAGETGPELSDAFRLIRSGTALTASLRLRIAIGIGILALMTIKPGAAGSWLVLAAAALSGLVASRPRHVRSEGVTSDLLSQDRVRTSCPDIEKGRGSASVRSFRDTNSLPSPVSALASRTANK